MTDPLDPAHERTKQSLRRERMRTDHLEKEVERLTMFGTALKSEADGLETALATARADAIRYAAGEVDELIVSMVDPDVRDTILNEVAAYLRSLAIDEEEGGGS